MGTAAFAEELPGVDELDELYKLDASETGPEDMPHEPEEEPADMPHVKPEDMPH